ncbi:class I SAM-dependent methyltransferase [Candidatus Kuenenia stuttgartensis]|uniref:class I SAM-dependent methyltransferase n=1 Tax=Kuenenia stuttgartiensis TaxID=174633 RepID=UPI00146C0606|nr:class I SAM-dependent methyltransferase [Candidatus Kuenenia stuttgartiensis]
MNDYLKVVYNEKERPYTDYPEKLCSYLFKVFQMSPGMKFLEAGCGRGEFLNNFKNLGLDVSGIDISNEAPGFQPNLPVKVCDIEKDGIPYPDETFDIIYSKSLLEHFHYPERYMKEAYRILKSGGILLTLVPCWESNYKIYFDDYTHRTPFTIVSLKDIYKIYGFKKVQVFKFRQLPIVWQYPYLNYFCAVISPFIPVRTKNKFLKWSRELMLCASGLKQ